MNPYEAGAILEATIEARPRRPRVSVAVAAIAALVMLGLVATFAAAVVVMVRNDDPSSQLMVQLGVAVVVFALLAVLGLLLALVGLFLRNQSRPMLWFGLLVNGSVTLFTLVTFVEELGLTTSATPP